MRSEILNSVRHAVWLLLSAASIATPQYVGSQACKVCHIAAFESQSRSEHARALSVAPSGSPNKWAFGAGAKAITYVSQDGDSYIEHGLSYYTATKSTAPTPGHRNGEDLRFRTFDSTATALRCFQCHSTGTPTLGAAQDIAPGELGVRCESCHGPGARHANSGGARGTIRNPKLLNASQLNIFCGSCHRKPPESGDEYDWSNSWNVRHQPTYLSRSACFRNSAGALSCVTCHDPHKALSRVAAEYDKRCAGCHRTVRHRVVLNSQSCVGCHMPQVPASPQLRFTNHWIGIYAKGSNLVPALRVARKLRPVRPAEPLPSQFLPPADPSNLKPLFERALEDREKELGPRHARTARSAFDLGIFLISTEGPAAAEKPLRKALGIDYANKDPLLARDQETLGSVLADIGKREEAIDLFERAAKDPNPAIAARCYSRLAILNADQAEFYYRKALAAEEAASSKDHPRLASILNDLALALRSRNDDRSAEPLFRRALEIEQKALGAASALTAMLQSNLSHLLQGAGQLDEAERLQRAALPIFEQKLGPDSKELSTACTKLADVLWAKGDKVSAANLFRRAISIDESIHGPDHPEVAANLTNLGTILNETGATTEARPLLRRALAIFENTTGPNSPEANYVRESLHRTPR